VYRPSSILFVLFLAGCSHSTDCSMGIWHDDCPPGSSAYQKRQQADAEASAAEAANAASDAAKCKANNLVPDTPPYERCLAQLENQREQTDTSDRAAVQSRLLGHHPF
jgi:hypothetical protein